MYSHLAKHFGNLLFHHRVFSYRTQNQRDLCSESKNIYSNRAVGVYLSLPVLVQRRGACSLRLHKTHDLHAPLRAMKNRIMRYPSRSLPIGNQENPRLSQNLLDLTDFHTLIYHYLLLFVLDSIILGIETPLVIL